MLIKGQSLENIKFGDTLGDGKTEDYLFGHKFHYMLANPPFGVKWEPEKDTVVNEHDNQGYDGRFGPGYPHINDGSFLFLQHMISKMQPYAHKDRQGSRIGIVFNGPPLFTGDAGSGESEIRKWIIENDWLEAIVALRHHSRHLPPPRIPLRPHLRRRHRPTRHPQTRKATRGACVIDYGQSRYGVSRGPVRAKSGGLQWDTG
jgi:hypothetical protein